MQKKAHGFFDGRKGWLLLICAVLIVAFAVLTIALGTERSTVVGLCYAEATDSSNILYRQALVRALQDKGYQVLELDADMDQAKQMEQIALMADRGCQALIVEPVMAFH